MVPYDTVLTGTEYIAQILFPEDSLSIDQLIIFFFQVASYIDDEKFFTSVESYGF